MFIARMLILSGQKKTAAGQWDQCHCRSQLIKRIAESREIVSQSRALLLRSIYLAERTKLSLSGAKSDTDPKCFGIPVCVESASVAHQRLSFSCTTSFGSLSSRNPTNFECRRCPSGVHSVNSICATNSGLSQMQFFISSRVSGELSALYSGKLPNGRSRVLDPRIFCEIS